GQPYIETVPRRGYLFAADAREIREAAEEESGDAPARATSTVTSTSKPVRTARALTLTTVVVVTLIAAGVTIWVLRGSPAQTPEYVQLTNYADSATSPAVSADGRMLVFLRGPDTFRGPGDVYVKLLPDGMPLQLTHDGVAKMSPVFSPDGA